METINLPAPAVRKVGDRVMITNQAKFPGVWIIQKISTVNTVLVPENGGRGLRCPHYMVTDVTDAPAVTVTAVPLQEYFTPGELVRITSGKFAGLYVVLADKGERVNVALLGGDGGRYVRANKGANLVKVAVEDVLK